MAENSLANCPSMKLLVVIILVVFVDVLVIVVIVADVKVAAVVISVVDWVRSSI